MPLGYMKMTKRRETYDDTVLWCTDRRLRFNNQIARFSLVDPRL